MQKIYFKMEIHPNIIILPNKRNKHIINQKISMFINDLKIKMINTNLFQKKHLKLLYHLPKAQRLLFNLNLTQKVALVTRWEFL